jgi:hypothetical protein
VPMKRFNRRIFWLDSGVPGRVYVYLSPDDAIGAASQFSRYGILGEGELPGPGDDRISGVTFGCEVKRVRRHGSEPRNLHEEQTVVVFPANRKIVNAVLRIMVRAGRGERGGVGRACCGGLDEPARTRPGITETVARAAIAR